MYICWECWRAEMKFKRAFFFQVLVEIFSTYFSTRDECRDIRRVLRKIVEKIKKSTRKKSLLKFHFRISQHSKQMYIGNFVYQGVALNTLGNNGLSRSIMVTSGLSVRNC